MDLAYLRLVGGLVIDRYQTEEDEMQGQMCRPADVPGVDPTVADPSASRFVHLGCLHRSACR